MFATTRSSTLARRVQVVQRALRLETRTVARAQRDWSTLLADLEHDPRPIVVTAANRPTFTIVAVNEKWVELCGFSHAEAIGNSLSLIQGPRTDKLVAKEASRNLAVSRAPSVGFEIVNYTKDGRPFVNTVQVSPVDVAIDGKVTPMFVGALSFKAWHADDAAPIAVEPAPAAAVSTFSLVDSLLLSGKSVEPARAARLAGARTTYDLKRLHNGLAF
ncbi:hypothetical protein KFE25_013997 [Diacronema lutheri]|uniref:PAS domain-containing protein n=1 Tax=Diacronema lutheri TaxID=2081491 RepID=A0A8J6CBY8_DIALT|nr:hypothetical protein KFE25_013997 [Diacronema lutheri]